MFDGGYIYRGYHSDMIRMACIGPPSSEELRLYDLVLAANTAAVQAAKPGVPCHALFEAALREFRRGGIQEQTLRSLSGFGHGVGLDVREPPFIKKDEETVLQAGMVLALEPWLPNLAIPGAGPGILVVEDMVIVTETGAELLTLLPRALTVVA